MPPRVGQTKARAGGSTRRPRGSLSPEEIVRGAFELIEAESVDELSMPRLARHLGVGVTSIYWYFRSKDELLDALAGQAAARFTEMMPTFTGYTWDDHLRHYFRALRRLFIENPALCDLILLRVPAQSPEARTLFFTRLEQELKVLVDAGFSVREAVHAYMTLSVYTRGCVLQDRLYTAAGRVPDGDEVRKAVAAVADPATMPIMAEAAEYWSDNLATDDDFEAGLDIVIEGLSKKLAQAQAQP